MWSRPRSLIAQSTDSHKIQLYPRRLNKDSIGANDRSHHARSSSLKLNWSKYSPKVDGKLKVWSLQPYIIVSQAFVSYILKWGSRGLCDLCSAAEHRQNRRRIGEVWCMGQYVSQRVNGLNGWIDVSNRRIALYKCTSANQTKEKALAITDIQTQTASCHCVRSDISLSGWSDLRLGLHVITILRKQYTDISRFSEMSRSSPTRTMDPIRSQ